MFRKSAKLKRTLKQYSDLPVGTVLLLTKAKQAEYLFKVHPGLWFDPSSHMIVSEQIAAGYSAMVIFAPQEQEGASAS